MKDVLAHEATQAMDGDGGNFGSIHRSATAAPSTLGKSLTFWLLAGKNTGEEGSPPLFHQFR